MKIFIGLTNIASQIADFKKGFSDLGHSVLVGLKSSNVLTDNLIADEIIDESIPLKYRNINKNDLFKKTARSFIRYKTKRKLWNKAFSECDIFIFFWSSFNNNYNDLEILKKNGKKVVVFFVGDDIRWKPACDQEFKKYNLPITEYNNYNYSTIILEKKLRYLRKSEKYADLIYGGPNLSQLALRPYSHFYVPISMDLFRENSKQREIPIVIHAPTNSKSKGTDYVNKAVTALRKDNIKFEFKLLQNIPYNKIISEYENSDILIEQLLSPGGGKQSRELLACGKIVLTNMAFHYPQNFDENNCPIIDVTPDTLYDKLKNIIQDYDFRKEHSLKGRKWAAEYHDTVKICSDLIAKLTDNKPDYYPRFFREEFIPESNESIKVYNKWTKYVSKCDWYKSHVKPGKRAGLKF